MDFARLRDADLSAVGTLAGAWGEVRQRVLTINTDAQDGVWNGMRDGNWEGESADTAQRRAVQLDHLMEWAYDEARGLDRVLTDAVDLFTADQEALRSVLEQIAAEEMLTVSEQGILDVRVPPSLTEEEAAVLAGVWPWIAEAAWDLAHTFQTRIDDILRHATELDGLVADALRDITEAGDPDDLTFNRNVPEDEESFADGVEDVRRPTAEILAEYTIDQVSEDEMSEYEFGSFGTGMDVSPRERELLDDLSYGDKLDFYRIYRDATDRTADHFGGEEEWDNGPADAWKHVYLSARMYQDLGPEFAERFGDAHETQPGTATDHAMDLYNNEIGRQIAAAHPDASNEELRDLAHQAVVDGRALVTVNSRDGHDGDLVYSDQADLPG